MHYFDTSFLVPFFLDEPTSSQVERFLKEQDAGASAISLWTCADFSSAIAQQVRLGNLSSDTALEVESEFDALISETFVTVAPTAEDFERSRLFLRRHETEL